MATTSAVCGLRTIGFGRLSPRPELGLFCKFALRPKSEAPHRRRDIAVSAEFAFELAANDPVGSTPCGEAFDGGRFQFAQEESAARRGVVVVNTSASGQLWKLRTFRGASASPRQWASGCTIAFIQRQIWTLADDEVVMAKRVVSNIERSRFCGRGTPPG